MKEKAAMTHKSLKISRGGVKTQTQISICLLPCARPTEANRSFLEEACKLGQSPSHSVSKSFSKSVTQSIG